MFLGRRVVFVCWTAWLFFGASATAATWQPLGEPGNGGQITGIAVSPHDPLRVVASGDMLGVAFSTDGGESWQETFGFKSWEMGAVTFHPTDPDIVWAGSMNGPYVSTDGGVNWQQRRDGFPAEAAFAFSAPVESITFDPNNTSRLIAVGGSRRRWPTSDQSEWGAVWESLDAGDSWTRLSTLTAAGSSLGDAPDGINITSLAFAAGSSTDLFATVDEQGFYRSEDGGLSWAKSNTGLPHPNINRVVSHPTVPGELYTTLDSFPVSETERLPGGVFKSLDGGLNWTAANNGLGQQVGSNLNNTSRYRDIQIAPTNPATLYTADYRFGSQHAVARTDDAGSNWDSLLTGAGVGVNKFDPAGVGLRVLAVDPNNEDRLFGGGSAFIVRTEDGGQTWEDLTSDQTTADGFRGSGFNGWVSTAVEFNPLDPSHVIVQGFDAARVLQTRDGGRGWSLVATDEVPGGNFGGGRDVVFAGQTIYATLGQSNAFEGVALSTDAGVTWEILSGNGLPEVNDPGVPNGVYASPNDPSTVYAAVGDSLLVSTADGPWTPALTTSTVGYLDGDPRNPDTFYVSAADGVYRTDDGVDFQPLGGPGKPGRLEVDSLGRVLLASHDFTGAPGNGVWRYDGTTWEQLFDDQYAVDVTVDPNNPLRIAVTTSDPPFRDESRGSGVYFSDDGGQEWRSLNDGLPMLRGRAISFNPANPNELVVGTTGRGFYRIRLDPLLGDFNADGTVDAADYTVWRDAFGEHGFGLAADHDASGIIDEGDYDLWRANFGATLNALPVPEPLPIAMALFLSVVAGVSRNHARRELAE
ncbi:MAG: hypothetical protein AAF266_15790 [Planctomycetota bacterium]